MGIPATCRPIDVPHASGATVRVTPLSQPDLIRLQAFTRFDPDDDATASIYLLNGIKMSVSAVVGSRELERAKPKYHRGLDAEVMPDEVADFVLQDAECVAKVVEAMHSAITAIHAPNSSRPPAGSSAADSGRPQSTSMPPDSHD